MRWLVAFLLLMNAFCDRGPVNAQVADAEKNADVLEACNAEFVQAFNLSVSEAVRRDGRTFKRSQLHPGICEATFSIIDENVYVSRDSVRSLTRVGLIYLRHKEFLKSMLRNMQQTKEELGITLPNVEFNFQTMDNPTCRYAVAHSPAAPPAEPVSAVLHHSFCALQLCNGTFLLPVSYNQEMQALEQTGRP
jgi:hypothetical protein